MPDATSLHHCLQNHHQYCIALNINRPVVNLAEAGLLPARASEQGNVIGSVRIYIYICDSTWEKGPLP